MEFKEKYFPNIDLNEATLNDNDPLISRKKIELPNMINEIDNLLNEQDG